MELAVRCRGLVKRYEGVVAVDGLDLEVPKGECFGLLGPNGAGKTTTVEILEGLRAADDGSIEVLGETWEQGGRKLRQRLGIQLQETRLIEKLSVLETITLFRSFYDRGPEPTDVLRQVGLHDKAKSWVGKLSGGQLQRLSLACALVSDPDLLFLDEPTTGLDPRSRRQIWDVVERFRAQGRTVFLTTHYMEEAARLCDRVAIMDQGKVIALGAPARLVAGLGAEHVVEFEVDGAIDTEPLASLAEVRDLTQEDGVTRLHVHELHRAVPALLAELQRQAVDLARLTTHHATLEDVFLELTGRHLAEDEEGSDA